MTETWKPATLYATGTLVSRATAESTATTPLSNPDFESGDTGWDKGAGFTITNTNYFSGTKSAQYDGPGQADITNQAEVPVTPGQVISAQCNIYLGLTPAAGRVQIIWYDASHVEISRSNGNLLSGAASVWKRSHVDEAVAPAGAAYARLNGRGDKTSPNPMWFDRFSWTYENLGVPSGLIFKATQATTASSGSDEPVWPTVAGGVVVDGGVTWTAVVANRVVWKMQPILKSGAVEPVWPENLDAEVGDNTISWVATTRQVTDVNCPQTAVAVIAASHVFAGDDDIVPFSAAVNPLDWTSAKNAGYLPTGLQNYGGNPVSALGLYRSKLVVFNSEAFQMWQIDEDPANNAMLDAMPIGSTHHKALCAVSDDLIFLSSEGVRSIGIAGGSTNLKSGDIGMPIDPLVKAAMAEAAAANIELFSLYVPARGQFWLLVPNDTTTDVFVNTMNRQGGVGWWSRYNFPFVITDWVLHGNDLLLRHGDMVSRMDMQTLGDEIAPGVVVPAPGIVQWSFLDFGAPGVEKEMGGFDIVGRGNPRVSIGYDQRDFGVTTEPYAVDPDTVPGEIIAMSLTAPSFSVRVDYDGTESWELLAFNFYVNDRRMTS